MRTKKSQPIHHMNFKVSHEGYTLMRLLAQQHGITMSALLELLLRERARLAGLLPPLKG